MFQLKPISKAAIPEALQKAERYRLLNEPHLAESICQDILDVEPDNHKAIVTKLLAITEQFGKNTATNANNARQLILLLSNQYEEAYFSGIICERQASAILAMGKPGGHFTAYDLLIHAMEFFEKAEKMRPASNDDAILRWNTCARLIMNNHLQPRQEQYVEPPLE